MNPTLETKLTELHRFTTACGVPVRRKDAVLYGALAACLELCEFVQSERLEQDLRDAVVRGTGGTKGSCFFKHTSDVYIMVCRYAFGGPKDRSSIVKYSQTIREAAARQIRSEDLAGWLAKNGGTRALYLKTRVYNGGTGSKRTLHLNQALDYPLTGEFTLRLRYDGRGFFDVI